VRFFPMHADEFLPFASPQIVDGGRGGGDTQLARQMGGQPAWQQRQQQQQQQQQQHQNQHHLTTMAAVPTSVQPIPSQQSFLSHPTATNLQVVPQLPTHSSSSSTSFGPSSYSTSSSSWQSSNAVTPPTVSSSTSSLPYAASTPTFQTPAAGPASYAHPPLASQFAAAPNSTPLSCVLPDAICPPSQSAAASAHVSPAYNASSAPKFPTQYPPQPQYVASTPQVQIQHAPTWTISPAVSSTSNVTVSPPSAISPTQATLQDEVDLERRTKSQFDWANVRLTPTLFFLRNASLSN